MAVDEGARHRVYNRAVEIFGEQEAEVLTAHLPPGGWSNLATKRDLLELEGRLKAHTLRTVIATNLSMAAILSGVTLAVAGLN